MTDATTAGPTDRPPQANWFSRDLNLQSILARRWPDGIDRWREPLADFAAAAHLSSLDYISDVDWNRSAVVKDWYAKIKSRPAFRSILADQVPGFRPPAHYTDLDF